MKLTEALAGSALAGAERGADGCWAIIHRSRGGFHLTRYSPDGAGRSQGQTWLFPNRYDLLIFARQHGFAEMAPYATDWRAVYGSAKALVRSQPPFLQ